MVEADSVHSTPPLNTSVGPVSGLAIQQQERQTSLQRLARLRKEARAEIARLIDFLDASDPYVMSEREDECEDEGAQCEDEGADTSDDEPWLGSGAVHEHSSQTQWVTPAWGVLDAEDEHDGAEPDDSGIGDMEGLLEQVGSQSWQLDGYI